MTIEDDSPIIFYSAGWSAGHSDIDKLVNRYGHYSCPMHGLSLRTYLPSSPNRYSQSSFTVTDSKDAFVSFIFNGTGVGIYGAKRYNHGLYQVKLDNTVYAPKNGSVADPGTFQESLFFASNLTQGLHNVTVINLEQLSFLDIDFVCRMALT